MDVIESVVRDLLKQGKLSRARALLSVFADEYPHLLFEVEAASGNYESAIKIYENLSEEKKKECHSLYEEVKSSLKEEGYRSSMKEALVEIEKRNFQGALALLEGITKDYPELVEAFALKYEIYLKRGDRAKAKALEEILRKVDPSHPSLLEDSVKVPSTLQKIFEPLLLGLIIATLLVSVSILVFIPRIGSNRVEEGMLENLAMKTASSVEIAKNDLKETFERKITDLRDSLVIMIDSVSGKTSENARKIEELSNKVWNLSSSLGELKKDIKTLSELMKSKAKVSLKNVLVPGEEIYRPSSQLDSAKITWLAGYILFLRGSYDDAIDLFKRVLQIVEKKFPKVYFHDDCYYYLALSYYMKGDFEEARKLFTEFAKLFPNSLYADDAKFFLEKIRGGEQG